VRRARAALLARPGAAHESRRGGGPALTVRGARNRYDGVFKKGGSMYGDRGGAAVEPGLIGGRPGRRRRRRGGVRARRW
jgi:hypothetical protein